MENQPNKFYYGKPENQRNPGAALPPRKQQRPQERNQRQPRPFPKNISKELPKPQRREDVSNVTLTETSASDESVFARNLGVRENTPRQEFNVAAPALIEISRQTYAELLTDDSSLGKQLLAEYLDYYSTVLLWFRIVTLKQRNSQSLSVSEQDILTIIQTASFCVPEPLMLQLKHIGNITTKTGQHLYTAFPAYPSQAINGHGGYNGILAVPNPAVNDDIHNQFEEIPCSGVTSSAVRAAVSNSQPGPYQSDVTYQGQQPTTNLLGFKPLTHRRNEAKNTALEIGITEDVFPEYPVNTGINFPFLMAVSNLLANTKTFKPTDVVFSTMTEAGSTAQTIIEHPQLDAGNPNMIAINSDLQPTSLTSEVPSTFGAGIFFCAQLLKNSIDDLNTSWSLFQNIPPAWINNRNERRNLPDEYLAQRFSSVSTMASPIRTNVIKTLVKEKR